MTLRLDLPADYSDMAGVAVGEQRTVSLAGDWHSTDLVVQATSECETCEGYRLIPGAVGISDSNYCPDCAGRGRPVLEVTVPCPEIDGHHRHLADGQWHDKCIRCYRRRIKGGTGCECDDRRISTGSWVAVDQPVQDDDRWQLVLERVA